MTTEPESRELSPQQMKTTRGGKTNSLEEVSFGLGVGGPGAAGAGGKVRLDEVTFTKTVDKASPKLSESTCTGKAHDPARIDFAGNGGKG